MNGKVGVNKKNENVASPTAARKVCNNCNSTGHLTHACKKVKVEQSETSSVPTMPTLNNAHLPCGKVGCMPCAFNIMSAYINLMNASSGSFINKEMIDSNKHVRAKTVSPPKVRKDTHISKPKVTPDKVKTKDMRKVNDPDEYVKVALVVTHVKISKPLGPKQVWVPKQKVIILWLQGNERKKRVVWIIDSGCSSYMTGDRALLSNLVEKSGPWVTFGDDNQRFYKGLWQFRNWQCRN